MYLIISILVFVIGVLLIVFARKIANKNKSLLIIIKVIGRVFVVLGLVMMYMLLSEKITLPLN